MGEASTIITGRVGNICADSRRMIQGCEEKRRKEERKSYTEGKKKNQ